MLYDFTIQHKFNDLSRNWKQSQSANTCQPTESPPISAYRLLLYLNQKASEKLT